jgi:hypothetical protein
MWPDRCLRAWQHGTHDVRHAPEVRCELLFDVGCGQLFEITHHGVARIIDRNVDPAELLRGLLDSRFRLSFVGNFQLDECEVLAATSRNAFRGFSRFLAVATTRLPAFNAALAIPVPMPLPAPVINQTLLIIVSLSWALRQA